MDNVLAISLGTAFMGGLIVSIFFLAFQKDKK